MSERGVDDDTPLRLADAVAIAFPMGGMTVSGLRRERDRGRLAVEIIAGKEFTTLSAIREMRQQCLVQGKAPASTSGRRSGGQRAALRSGPSETGTDSSALDAALMRAKMLKGRLPDTSRKSTTPSAANVVSLKSR